MAGATQSDDDFISQINVTPLVDVMLVLLIVMMVTASTIVARALDVELPQGATGTEAGTALVLALSAEGEVSMDGTPLDAEALRQLAAQQVASAPTPRAVIAADGAVAHRHVVRVMDILRGESLTHVAIGVVEE